MLTVPNLLTFLRIGIIPVFAWAVLTGRHRLSLLLFIGAAVTDVLDGVLARALKQFSKLGAFLDPLADKALGISALVLLCLLRELPWWLLALTAARDAAIFLAIGILQVTGRRYAVRPIRFGKYATFFLAVTTVLGLVLLAHPPARLAQGGLLALVLITGLSVALSWLNYLWIFVQLIRIPPGGELPLHLRPVKRARAAGSP